MMDSGRLLRSNVIILRIVSISFTSRPGDATMRCVSLATHSFEESSFSFVDHITFKDDALRIVKCSLR